MAGVGNADGGFVRRLSVLQGLRHSLSIPTSTTGGSGRSWTIGRSQSSNRPGRLRSFPGLLSFWAESIVRGVEPGETRLWRDLEYDAAVTCSSRDRAAEDVSGRIANQL